MKIKKIVARQIIDSRGNPTIEADVQLDSGNVGRAAVPSGASTGAHEAHELRDHQPQFDGKSVLKAVSNVNDIISPKLIGLVANDQSKIDQIMIDLDGTDQKNNLGANSILSVSLACAKAAALEKKVNLYQHIAELGSSDSVSLPMPMINVLNGGKHALHSTDIQENMIVPIGANDLESAIRMSVEVFQALKRLLLDLKMSTTVGDEGGFAPNLNSNLKAIELMTEAITNAGYKIRQDFVFAVDVAASELYKDNDYAFEIEGQNFNAAELIDWYKNKLLPDGVVSIEDGLAQDDWKNWTKMTQTLTNIQIVGDDLLVTNSERLEKAIQQKSANAILIKPNQIGTLTETINTIKQAQAANFKTIVSHRSGETEDISIVHLAVGMNCGQIKTGGLSRGERISKYNELLRLSEDKSLVLSKPFLY